MKQPELQRWYKWPLHYFDRSWKPWYKIARAFIFFPLFYLFFVLMYISIILMNGIEEAEDSRKNLF